MKHKEVVSKVQIDLTTKDTRENTKGTKDYQSVLYTLCP